MRRRPARSTLFPYTTLFRSRRAQGHGGTSVVDQCSAADRDGGPGGADRKSTRLNSSHLGISYAAFRLKKGALEADSVARPQGGEPNFELLVTSRRGAKTLVADQRAVAVEHRALLGRLVLFNDPATPEIYSLSLRDALPI